MKINIFLNDFFISYKKAFIKPKIELDLNIIKKIPPEGNLIILRGEPTLYSKLNDLLKFFYEKKYSYIITTDADRIENLFLFKGFIPYLSINYDGFINDYIRGNRLYLTSNILKALNFYAGKKTILRLAYTISPYNKEWINVDLLILRHLYEKYEHMKKPYILIHQQGPFFLQKDFSWTSVDVFLIDKMNKLGLLTDKTLRYLIAYHDKATFSCVAPRDEVVITPDAKVRLCMSFRMKEILGDLKIDTFENIINNSFDKRNSTLSCQYRQKCWLSFNAKTNINKHI